MNIYAVMLVALALIAFVQLNAYTDEKFIEQLANCTGDNFTFSENQANLSFETSKWCVFGNCYDLKRNVKVIIMDNISTVDKGFSDYNGYAKWYANGGQPTIYLNRMPTTSQTIALLHHEFLHEWIFYNNLGSGHNMRFRYHENIVRSRLGLAPFDYGTDVYQDIIDCPIHSTCEAN